jgi:hypothetical protein
MAVEESSGSVSGHAENSAASFTRRQVLAISGMTSVAAAFITNINTITDWSERMLRALDILPEPPRPHREAVLHFVRVGARDVTPVQAAELVDRPIGAGFPQERRKWLGLMIAYRAEFKGLDNEPCTVKWTLLTDENVPVFDSYWTTVNALGWPSEGWDPEATDSDVQEGDIWVPYIDEGRYYVAVAIHDSRNEQLAEMSTEPFVVVDKGG